MNGIHELLQYALENDMLDVNSIRESIAMKKKQDCISKHPFEIWQGNNGLWYTYIKGDNKKRKLIKRKSEDAIIQFLQEYYCPTRTFKEYWVLWVERQELCGRSANTINKYASDYQRFLSGTKFENLDVTDIYENDVAKFLREILASKEVPFKALQGIFGEIRAVFEKAIRDRVIEENPCKYLDLPMFKRFCKEKVAYKSEDRTLSDLERKLLDEKINKKIAKKPTYMPIYAVKLSTLTGMRVGEISGLMWDDISYDRKLIYIRHSEKKNRQTNEYTVEDTKNHKERIFPMTSEIEKLLKSVYVVQMQNGWLCDYVFANDKGKLHSSIISDCMRNITAYDKRFSGAKSIHSNRRTLNSNMRCNGISAVVASSLLGNTVRCNDEHYTYDTRSIDEKMKAVSDAYKIG